MPVWFRLFYRALWVLAMPFALARLWWKGRLNPAYRRHWGERLAFDPPVVPFDVWIHAVSVGEARAIQPLIHAFTANHMRLLITCATPTGRATLCELFGNSACIVYLPFDAPGLVHRFLSVARPALALLVETELWPGVAMGHVARAFRSGLSTHDSQSGQRPDTPRPVFSLAPCCVVSPA